MAAPAKLEFNFWIDTIRKHIEHIEQVGQVGQVEQTSSKWGKRKPATVSTPTQAALESLKSLHDELIARSSMLEFSPAIEPEAAPANPFSGALAQEFASQIAGQIADQVVSTLAAQLSQQLSQQLSEQISTLFESNREHRHAPHDECKSELGAIQNELATAYETVAELQVKLNESKSSVWSLDRNHDSQNENEVVADLQAEIASLQTALAAMRTDCWQVTDSNSSVEIVTLTAELAAMRQHNADLAMQLARAQISSYPTTPPHLNLSALNQESMTWEQRKKLILQQLENESETQDHPGSPHLRINIEDVLRTTQAEIDRRDEEIAELRSIVQQQSNTREGVAIGAAAIAQMLDSDELVKLEREKLIAIQREWESKLREAEIQMSIERAKLSRERAELEMQIRASADQTNNLPSQSNAIPNADNKPVRRWLEHLGLQDT